MTTCLLHTHVYVLEEIMLGDGTDADERKSIHWSLEGAQAAAAELIDPSRGTVIPVPDPVWQRPRHTKDIWSLTVPATFGRKGQRFWIARVKVLP